MARTAGIILCGGRSNRMGRDKASLRLPGGTMVQRMADAMGQAAGRLVISLAADQDPPSLTQDAIHVRDPESYPGPLWGMAEAFRRLQGEAEHVLVASVDMPFYSAPWMKRLLAPLSSHAACLYRWEGFTNALTAAYRLDLMDHLDALIRAGKRRPIMLIENQSACVLEIESLWSADDGPSPVMDMDTPDDYRQVLLLEGAGSAGGLAWDFTVAQPGAGRDLRSGKPALLPLFIDGLQDAYRALEILYADWLAQAAQLGLAPHLELPDGTLARLSDSEDSASRADREAWRTMAQPLPIIWAPAEQ